MDKGVLDFFSLQDIKTGLVVAYSDRVTLQHVRFVVNAGRLRVLCDQVKNVHAMGRGTLIALGEERPESFRPIVYDPYKYETFVDETTKEAIYYAEIAYFQDRRVWVPQKMDLLSIV